MVHLIDLFGAQIINSGTTTKVIQAFGQGIPQTSCFWQSLQQLKVTTLVAGKSNLNELILANFLTY